MGIDRGYGRVVLTVSVFCGERICRGCCRNKHAFVANFSPSGGVGQIVAGITA